MISSQFIQSCQSGDENAIRSLVRTYQRAVFQLALSILDDGHPAERDAAGRAFLSSAPDQAEAATRETFIAALDRMGRYREDSNFEIWLYGITVQISRRRARRWRARRGVLGVVWRTWRAIIHPPATDSDGLEISIRQEEPAPPAEGTASADPHLLHPGDAELWLSVRHLDEKLRIPVVLRYYHDYPISEIARLLHISEGTVHARLDAAREKIALRIE
jgi:RNA polymerase sigma-70 factor, ECF subfamily